MADEADLSPTTIDIIPGAGLLDLRAGHQRAVLLLHGFGDTPQTLRHLAVYLHERGYDVRVPLLPGHGRSVADLDATSHQAWIDAARSELIAMRARYAWSALGGLSMGGALAVILAAELRDLQSLVLLAPYLAMPAHVRVLAACCGLWSDRVGPFRSSSPYSIHDPKERGASLSYGAVTGRAMHELALVVARARSALSRVTAPTLIVQSREDNRVSERVARYALARLGSRSKRLVFTSGAGHIITVDYGRERVFGEVQNWLERGPGTALQPVDRASSE